MAEPENRTSDIAGQGRPTYNLPYRTGNSERPRTLPRSPKNVMVTSPFLIGVLDIRWDNPADYAEHNGMHVLGVNIYRAFDAPEASYTKLNATPASALNFRDQTREIPVVAESEIDRLDPGNNPRGEWVIRTLHKKIVVPGTQGIVTNSVTDVAVEIDNGDGHGYLPVVPLRVTGETGEITLNTNRVYDPATNTYTPARLPNIMGGGGIRLYYSYVDVLIANNINRKIYYKVSTVAQVADTAEIKETPLSECVAVSPYDMEVIDYIWAEAIRRNHWLLEQTGERCKLFLRKWNGQQCSCGNYTRYGYSKRLGINQTGSGVVSTSCPLCYGSGFVGGYEGPYDMLLAPPETEKSVNLTDIALHVTYDWQTWTGPYPLLNDRDVIVRSNNDRFYVEHVNYQGLRGNTLQQHFSLSHVDSVDPIYTLPIDGGELGVPPAWNAYRTERPVDASPIIPVKPGMAPGLPIGRTVTFENIVL